MVKVPIGILWDKEEIVICWDDEYLTKDKKDYLQSVTTKYWDENISIDFIGWKLCSDTESPDVVIKNIEEIIVDGASYSGRTDTHGMPKPENFPDHIQMVFGRCDNFDYIDLCLRKTFLHEIGHVLNLIHEQSREDTPEWCTKLLADSKYKAQSNFIDQELIGPWDINSIMNYCGNSSKPSYWDIKQVQQYYGKEKK